jgi:hypothetical protein
MCSPSCCVRPTAFTAISAGRLGCPGVLTIKGKSLTVKLPSRKAFGIGSAVWNHVLEDKIIINFHILNNRQFESGRLIVL